MGNSLLDHYPFGNPLSQTRQENSMKTLLLVAALATTASTAAAQVPIDDTPDRPEERAPAKEGAQPVIPLNIEDPTYDLWKRMREDLREGREPGPIDIQRFYGGTGWNGIPTFFRLPVALTPEDLAAGNVDVAILGGYTDMGGGYRGAAFGPRALRSSHVYQTWGAFTMPHMHTMIDPFQDLTIVDYGDAPVDHLSTERSMQPIREMVRDIAAVQIEGGDHVIPIIVGGDHSLMYPDAAGLADVYGKGNVGVIHFDAHYDASKYFFGHLISHGQPVYRLISEGHVPGRNFIQVGLRGYYPDQESFEWMREQGFRYHPMAEIERRGFDAVMDDIIAEANDGPEYIFISFDIDVLDPAYTPGTGTPEPGGLTTREVFPLIRRLCAESNVVGFELVELNPLVDPGYTTALNSNRVIRECLVGIAMRKKGITESHYLSPYTVDDGRD
jgi:agmatinase